MMSRQLSPQHEAVVARIIASGRYENADDVIGQALDLLEEHELIDQPRAKLQSGIDQLDRGEGIVYSAQWSAERACIARERAAAGATPHPDVCP